MRILHIIIGLNVGGAELMLKRLVESHRESTDYSHSVISLTDIGKVGVQLKAQGVEVKSLGMRSPFSLFFILWKLVQIIRDIKPDIVQTWMYHADLLGGIAARLAGVKNVIWGIRTTDISAGGSRLTIVVRKVCAWLSSIIPRVIVCAAEASRQVHVSVGYDASRMSVIPNGFDLVRLQATKEQRLKLRVLCGFSSEILVVGSLGRFNWDKDQKNFVQAAALVAEKYPNVYFLMVGRKLDKENLELSDWISKTGYSDRFVLLGERSDVPVCLSAMDVFCLHSRTEGFPNVLGEAMTMSVTAVTTDVGDAALLLGDCGEVVVKEDAIALAKGLEKQIKRSVDERFFLGQKAKERIKDEFTLEHTRDRFEQIYKKVIEGGRY